MNTEELFGQLKAENQARQAVVSERMHKEFFKGMVYVEIGRLLCREPFKTAARKMYVDEKGSAKELYYAGGLLTEEELAQYCSLLDKLIAIERGGDSE